MKSQELLKKLQEEMQKSNLSCEGKMLLEGIITALCNNSENATMTDITEGAFFVRVSPFAHRQTTLDIYNAIQYFINFESQKNPENYGFLQEVSQLSLQLKIAEPAVDSDVRSGPMGSP